MSDFFYQGKPWLLKGSSTASRYCRSDLFTVSSEQVTYVIQDEKIANVYLVRMHSNVRKQSLCYVLFTTNDNHIL